MLSLGRLDEAKKLFDKNVTPIKILAVTYQSQHLSKKNFFLYDDSNIINYTFYTQLNQKVQTYGLISTAALGIRSTHMIATKKCLKFKVKNEEYKENIVIQLERITKEESIKVKDDKVTNFSILATREKKKVANKRPMPYEITEQGKIGGLQNFDKYNELNPLDINTKDSEVNSFLARFKRYKYRFVIDNLLFSSALTNDANVIFVSCNGHNEAKDSLINGKLFKTLGVINDAEIEHWDKIKGKSK